MSYLGGALAYAPDPISTCVDLYKFKHSSGVQSKAVEIRVCTLQRVGFSRVPGPVSRTIFMLISALGCADFAGMKYL